jgi:hypothetical protein
VDPRSVCRSRGIENKIASAAARAGSPTPELPGKIETSCQFGEGPSVVTAAQCPLGGPAGMTRAGPDPRSRRPAGTARRRARPAATASGTRCCRPRGQRRPGRQPGRGPGCRRARAVRRRRTPPTVRQRSGWGVPARSSSSARLTAYIVAVPASLSAWESPAACSATATEMTAATRRPRLVTNVTRSRVPAALITSARSARWSVGAGVGGWIGFGGDAGGDPFAEPDLTARLGEVLVAGLG